MIDKLEPPMDSPKPRQGDEEAAAAPRPQIATPSAAPASAATRAKGPPQDPVAFERWLGIERLKVDMRRLELETKQAETPPARGSHPALPMLFGLVLVALFGLVAFLAAQVLTMREDIAALRSAQSEVAERLAAGVPQSPAAVAAQPDAPQAAAAPSAPSPADAAQTAAEPLIPPAPTASSSGAANGTPAPPASTETAPSPPALPGTGYTVRIFAPVNSVPQAKIDNFTKPLKAAGFDVVVSDTGVVQTTSNTLSYHAATTDMANELSNLLQKKNPSLGIELRASPSIPDNARQILILNLTDEAFN